MAKHQSYVQEMEEAFAAIQLEEEEQGGLNYADASDGLSEIDTNWCLVGRFLTDSPIDSQAMQHKMASLWRPGRGLYVKQLENNRFLFQFYHEMDIRRVIEGSPWTFGRFHLVMERLKPGENPRMIAINKIDLWVQLHGMSAGFMSQRVATDIGNYIGTYVEGDANNFVGVWRDYLRIRVTLSLDTPIKRRMKLRKSDKEWCWVNFQYEAIPTFCFICGMIGHGERFCDKVFDMQVEKIEKPYGPWLRADSRKKVHTMGSKWLRSGGGSQVGNSGDSGGVTEDKIIPVTEAMVQQTSVYLGKELQRKEVNQGAFVGVRSESPMITSQDVSNLGIIRNSILTLEGISDGPDNIELNVLDPKRRRMELGNDTTMFTVQAQVTDVETQGNSTESKNELLAGAAMQTRQSL